MTGIACAVAAGGWPPLSASASPASVSGTDFAPNGSTPRTPVTNSTTITPGGGAGGYTFAWSHVSGSTATVASPTSASTTFSRTHTAGVLTGVYRCTVTDAAGQTASADVTVQTEVEIP